MPAPSIRIDALLCTGCGRCLAVCPSRTLALHAGKAVVAGPACIGCLQCLAVCPEGAAGAPDRDAWAETPVTFAMDDGYVSPGDYPVEDLVRLMRSRRSVRSYAEEPVPMETLEDLVRIGLTAPSGTNSQAWTFTLVPDREAMLSFARNVARFFAKLNSLAANPAVRLATRLIGRRELEDYYREHYRSVAGALREWEEHGRDRLFHGAPAAIVIGSGPRASCPGEDALLAAQNILLGAHAMGLGTCLIGYAVEAMRRDRRIGQALGIARDEPTYAVIAVGHPKTGYVRPTGRRRPVVRVAGRSIRRVS